MKAFAFAGVFGGVSFSLSAAPDEAAAKDEVVKIERQAVTAANQSLIEKLERGEIFAARLSTSFVMQGLIKQDSDKIVKAFSEDVHELTHLIPDLAFARVFKGSGDQKLLYLKVSGLGQGSGILTEVVTGFDEMFKGAPTLPIKGTAKRIKPSGVNIMNPWESMLAAEIEKTSASTLTNRTIGGGQQLRIVGPLHDSFALEGLSVDLQIAFKPYTIEKKPDPSKQIQIGQSLRDQLIGRESGEPGTKIPQLPSLRSQVRNGNGDALQEKQEETGPEKYTLMLMQISFAPVTPKQSLGDFRGFGEKKLITAMYGAQKFMTRFRDNLERMN